MLAALRIAFVSLTAVCVLMLSGLAGCGTGHVSVAEAPVAGQHFSTAEVSESGSTVTVPADAKVDFQAKLTSSLGKEGFAPGKGLHVTYRFTSYDEGSQAARWALGGLGNSGEGRLTVDAEFFDQSGKRLGKITAEGRINSGVVGGGFSNARARAADEIARYAAQNFK